MARASPALRGFLHAFSPQNPSKTVSTIPVLLALPTAQGCPTLMQTQGLKYPRSPRHISVAASQRLNDDSDDVHVCSTRGLPLDVEALIYSPRRREPSAWVTAIESYLPMNLRTGAKSVAEKAVRPEALRTIKTLPEILSMARSYCKADLLSYIGVYQERWEAVTWLVKAMMEDYPGHREMERRSCQLPPLLWETVNQSLNEITGNAVHVEMSQFSEKVLEHSRRHGNFSLDEHPWPNNIHYGGDTLIIGRKSLGQIWQGLGTMILQAADRPAEDPSYTVIMSHVFQILGHLHRINAFPDSIYNYAPPIDPTVLQRPPTLHLLSRRIMSTLSDVEWGLQWEETITKALSEGYELPKASVQPKIREFGPELWLDLVLWACVEGGWICEGAWILSEMQRRSASRDMRWSTISWPEICERKAPKIDWTSILRLEIDKTRLNQVGGIGIATGTNSHVEMGTRTVSWEVVSALIDGLLNGSPSTAGDLGRTTVELQRGLIACKGLIDYNDSKLESNFMNAVILRIFESSETVREHPASLDRIVDLNSIEHKQATRSPDMRDMDQDRSISESAPVLGLRHRNLRRFSADGNLQGSLETFRKIQRTIDTQRERIILAFADELHKELGEGDDVSNLTGEDRVALIHPPPVALSALVSFIDLITNTRLFDLGNWLLTNEDIDGGLMDPALYSDQNLQPALLRFGTATSDPHLLTKILVSLETPLSEPVIHALLRFQAALRKWTAVEELLEYVKNSPNMAWKPSDATTIAKAVLQMEHEPPDNVDADSISRALSLIQNLVNGKYNSKANPSDVLPDFSETRKANQLGRILQNLPGSLSRITTRPPREDRREHASAVISPNAFNIILETIVDCYGSLAGKTLWDQWCRVPNTRKREQQARQFFGYGERVVTPTLYMLRSVLRPVLEIRRALHASMKDELAKTQSSKTTTSNKQEASISVTMNESFRLGDEDQKILDWGINMYKMFGLSDSEIKREIPGSLPRHRRAKTVHDELDVDNGIT